MSRTTSLDRRGVQERSVGETAVVAVLSSLGLVAAALTAAATWAVVGGVPLAGYPITVGVALVVAVALPAGMAQLGRAVVVAARSDSGRDARTVRPTTGADD